MKIVADENIPYVKQAFAELGKVTTLPGRHIKTNDLLDCDCLLVRSITRVNQKLLHNTPVKFVASATIGTDHVDLDYLQKQHIGFANAPGCNAESAAEYMINVLFELAHTKGFNPFDLTAGIIGFGNVGSRVKSKLDVLGINTLVNDPPLRNAGSYLADFVSLQNIIHNCDFITCHVPLTKFGKYPTYHLLDNTLLNELGDNTILFNAARGAVVDNQALSELLNNRNDLTVFLDTWEGEPAIDPTLLKQVDFGTPHIAGYSYEGRLRGTQMILYASCAFFKRPVKWSMHNHLPENQTIQVTDKTDPSLYFELFKNLYPVVEDYQRLLKIADLPTEQLGKEFDRLRKHYPVRYEYSHYRLTGLSDNKNAATMARQLLFEIE